MSDASNSRLSFAVENLPIKGGHSKARRNLCLNPDLDALPCVQLNARSKSGQLAGIRQPPPPPPPPAEHRGNATPRVSNMARQTSAPQPKDGATTARQQPNRNQGQQQQQGTHIISLI